MDVTFRPVLARAGIALVFLVACSAPDDPRTPFIAESFVEADYALFQSRPDLVEGKYVRMADSLYAYYRGNMPVFTRDATRGASPITDTAFPAGVLPLTTGDAHPENFGILVAADESLAFEPNDFDSADRYPYFWDLRRLTAGLVIAARLSNPEDEAAQQTTTAEAPEIAAAAARAYREGLRAYADGAPRERVTESTNPNIADLFRRGLRDLGRRDELNELTEAGPDRSRVYLCLRPRHRRPRRPRRHDLRRSASRGAHRTVPCGHRCHLRDPRYGRRLGRA
ncbi:MAG: DUF2252 family protein [Myxococcota bacterium]